MDKQLYMAQACHICQEAQVHASVPPPGLTQRLHGILVVAFSEVVNTAISRQRDAKEQISDAGSLDPALAAQHTVGTPISLDQEIAFSVQHVEDLGLYLAIGGEETGHFGPGSLEELLPSKHGCLRLREEGELSIVAVAAHDVFVYLFAVSEVIAYRTLPRTMSRSSRGKSRILLPTDMIASVCFLPCRCQEGTSPPRNPEQVVCRYLSTRSLTASTCLLCICIKPVEVSPSSARHPGHENFTRVPGNLSPFETTRGRQVTQAYLSGDIRFTAWLAYGLPGDIRENSSMRASGVSLRSG